MDYEGTPASKEQMLERIRAARSEWEAALSRVRPEQMEEPALDGGLSIKDIVAHITWFEREMVGMLKERALLGSDLWLLPTDERNALIHQENRSRSLEEVLAEADEVYRQFLEQLEKVEYAELLDPARFREMPPDWEPWRLLAENSYLHYRDHARDVNAWMDEHLG